ncbi:uncharacterized protein LOC108023317 [Drosophila biarmipes]|uniref:uncharacterized protein LOC108023317 n=1 Tax=Drosophila biarmipes TaxID=125945 RepID=UPI0007E705CF|nr:uncharacterized protein LOC108023317 [Drosophila biarmipes]
MRSIILVLALALAAVSAVPLKEDHDVASLQELVKELGLDLDLDLNFDLDLRFNLDDETLLEEGNVAVGEYVFLNRLLSFFVDEAKALARDIIRLTERQLLKIFLYPVRELEKLAEDIERRAQDAGECAVNVTTSAADVVALTTVEFLDCGYNAAATSIDLVLDTKKAVLQLTVGSYQLYKLHRKCNNYKSSALKSSCEVRFYAKLALFATKAPGSLVHLIGLRNSVPAVANDATACTNEATQNAIRRFDALNAALDDCAAHF